MGRHRENIERWLAAKIPGAGFDEAGAARISHEPDAIIFLELSPEEDICHFCALVAALHEDMPQASLFAALELNRFGKPLDGSWLAWEPEAQRLSLCCNLALDTADEARFGKTFDRFITALDAARTSLLPEALTEERSPSMEFA